MLSYIVVPSDSGGTTNPGQVNKKKRAVEVVSMMMCIISIDMRRESDNLQTLNC